MRCAGCGNGFALADALCPTCGRFVIEDLSEADKTRRDQARGPGRLVAIGLVLGTLFFIGLIGCLVFRRPTMHARSPRSEMVSLHPVAEKYVVDHPGVCPTVSQLLVERELSPGTRLDDPWGSRYRIECADDDEVFIHSNGPDRQPDTADDTIIPARVP